MPPSLAKNWGMPNKDRSFHESPEKAGGEGWLYSEQQQKLSHFKPDTATVHAQWVAIRTYSYVPLRPPEPMTRRRMLRHNAIEAWQTMHEEGLEALPPLCAEEWGRRGRGNPLDFISQGVAVVLAPNPFFSRP